MAKEIPVYLFVGFLESGKTKFIQETFEDPNFDSGDKTLLLICEEGEEEYNPKKFAFPGVTVKVLEDKAELNPQNLLKLEKESGAGRVVIEYNGMWLLQDLAEALPELTSCNDYLDIVPKGNKIPTTLADFEALLRDEYTIGYIQGLRTCSLIPLRKLI